MNKILDGINGPKDVKRLSVDQLKRLCDEVREFTIESVSKTGGHFGSNLGVVELTVALHRVFDTPQDLLVWDVGHQTYPHKVLTGRKDRLHTIRQKGGLAPFPKRCESKYDALDVGHSSTSIGAATGMAVANKNKKNPPNVIAIIGDGALGGGMAFEALNHAGDIKANMLVILNDNEMSISPNVGAMHKYLTRLISSPSYTRARNKGRRMLDKIPSVQKVVRRAEEHTKGMLAPSTLFEELGFEYFGPIDGHDILTLVEVLSNLKKISGPRILHVVTEKGKGCVYAEKDIFSLHAVKPFDAVTGKKNGGGKKNVTFTDVFSDWVCEMAKKDEKLHAITPAMCDGSGLSVFCKKFPDRYHDVGIAEQHAVIFAAGLACEGEKPVVAIYSSFFQRAFDQLIHDIAIQNLNVLFAVDRAGIVGRDGATHAGSFDLSFMRAIPNLVIMAPSDENECYAMLNTGYQHNGPVAVRYPRGGEFGKKIIKKTKILEIGKAKIVKKRKNIAILAFGVMVERSKKVAREMNATLVDMRFVKPLDKKLLEDLSETHKYFVTIEDNVVAGGAGSAVNEFALDEELGVRIKNIGLPDKFLEHGSRDEILADVGLDEDGILKTILSFISK